MLLLALILFLVANAGLSGVLGVRAFDFDAGSPVRRGLLIITGVLIANTAVFLTIYALYTNGILQ
jgi:hypothetical protein